LALPLLNWATEPHLAHPDALGIAHKIAEAQGHVVTKCETAEASTGDYFQALHHTIKEGGDATAALSAALADGKITQEERRVIARELKEAIRAFSAALLLAEPQEARGQA